MLYFSYGSNLNHLQMKRRCKDNVFLKKINLSNFKLTFRSKYRAADIEPKKNSIVPGALFEISKSDEKKLDVYEDYPILYKKYYFTAAAAVAHPDLEKLLEFSYGIGPSGVRGSIRLVFRSTDARILLFFLVGKAHIYKNSHKRSKNAKNRHSINNPL